MALVGWQEKYRVGAPTVDKQHQNLFRLINDLHEAMVKGHGQEVLDKTLDELIQYTRSHFQEEEAMLVRCKYPKLTAHRAEHEALTKQVVDLQRDFRAGKAMISVQVLRFLNNWLEQHILKTDFQYASFLALKQ